MLLYHQFYRAEKPFHNVFSLIGSILCFSGVKKFFAIVIFNESGNMEIIRMCTFPRTMQ